MSNFYIDEFDGIEIKKNIQNDPSMDVGVVLSRAGSVEILREGHIHRRAGPIQAQYCTMQSSRDGMETVGQYYFR